MEKSFKIYTKTGDNGTSGLIGGTRVSKTDQRLEAYGTVDELNSWIGLIRTTFIEDEVSQTLELIQNKLFVIGSYLATDSSKSDLRQELDCGGAAISKLENEIDRMQEQLPVLTHFVLPGGTQSAAHTHIARTVCRRAERRITAIEYELGNDKNALKFINRLSDYLFVLARYNNYTNKQNETLWNDNKG
ncbi:MAG: cob(I)yrinic acid a,c-diamide adenosyltransferase [Prolixibacteraceae bacterium]|nr:cob(I)yrinic acid a,c-diamide adenosyltransferase [Prolixibacteraceae bacterium]MBN2650198.1 cob(I)yrinic acid a,c-diamide adenosyltransferase [Prolixibacteraceae bacterium]